MPTDPDEVACRQSEAMLAGHRHLLGSGHDGPMGDEPRGPDWLTTDEACAYLEVQPRILDRLEDDGEVRSDRSGRFRWWRRSDLDAWAEGQRIEPDPGGWKPREHRNARGRRR